MRTYRDDGAFAQAYPGSVGSGLTKREFLVSQIAAAAFERFGDETPDPVNVAKLAKVVVQFADAIINALNEN